MSDSNFHLCVLLFSLSIWAVIAHSIRVQIKENEERNNGAQFPVPLSKFSLFRMRTAEFCALGATFLFAIEFFTRGSMGPWSYLAGGLLAGACVLTGRRGNNMTIQPGVQEAKPSPGKRTNPAAGVIEVAFPNLMDQLKGSRLEGYVLLMLCALGMLATLAYAHLKTQRLPMHDPLAFFEGPIEVGAMIAVVMAIALRQVFYASRGLKFSDYTPTLRLSPKGVEVSIALILGRFLVRRKSRPDSIFIKWSEIKRWEISRHHHDHDDKNKDIYPGSHIIKLRSGGRVTIARSPTLSPWEQDILAYASSQISVSAEPGAAVGS